MKPRIFLGSCGTQEKLLQALTRGLEASRTSSPGPHPSIQGPPPSNASSNWRTRSTSLRSYSRGTTGRAAVQGRPRPQGRVRLLHETTSSSRPASSAEPSECVGPSFSTRAAPSSRAISSASRAYDTKRRRPRGHDHPGRKRRAAARGADRGADQGLEVDHESLKLAALLELGIAMFPVAHRSAPTHG